MEVKRMMEVRKDIANRVIKALLEEIESETVKAPINIERITALSKSIEAILPLTIN